jgi:hypothetical protein
MDGGMHMRDSLRPREQKGGLFMSQLFVVIGVRVSCGK